jgi:capsular polysaccharide export protein
VKRGALHVPRKKYPAVAVSSAGWLNETNKYLPQLLNAEQLMVPKNDAIAARCSGFVQWGAQESDSKARLRAYATSLNRPLAYIEDGFIRSYEIGLSQEPGRSIIVDDLGFYYDAQRASRLETTLNSDWRMGFLAQWCAKSDIRFIVENGISKYNNAPDRLPAVLASGRTRRRVLLLDQRAGDASIPGALASDASFQQMVDHAFSQGDVEVVVKVHPDALTPGKFSAVSPSLTKYRDDPRLVVISEAVNPYVLFAAVDEVYVVASGMGFEALMAGKPVSCFGLPYYAGWGATTDFVTPLRPRRQRSVAEVFYVGWVMLSRYIDPGTKHLTTVRKAAQLMAAERRSKQTQA